MKRPHSPSMSGTRVRKEDQANMMPPQEIGMRSEVLDAVRRIAPAQSKFWSLLIRRPEGCCSRRKKGSVRKPKPQKGRFTQKIQRQLAFWAKVPPIKGPVTEPSAHVRLWKPNHLPRSRKGTRSVMRISVREMMPPPPIPWMLRPIKREVIFWASAQTIAPTVKKTRARRSKGLRPKRWESEAKVG